MKKALGYIALAGIAFTIAPVILFAVALHSIVTKWNERKGD